YRFAMSLDTTTQVRSFLGSAPIEGSHRIQRMSPRRGSRGSSGFIDQVELRDFEIGEQLARVFVPGRVILCKLAPPFHRFAVREGFAEQRPRERRAADLGALRVKLELPGGLGIECQIEPLHDT